MSGRRTGADERGFTRCRGALAALAIALAVIASASAVGVAVGQVTEPPYRDIDAATAQLAEAQALLVEAERTVADALVRLEQSRTARADTDEAQLAYAIDMQASQQRARQMAVAAYMSGGALPDAVYLLDSDTANDFAYRTGILTESANAVASMSRTLFELRSNASSASLDLADEIDEAARAVEVGIDEVTRLERVVDHAEYVVWIADIHALATAAHERFGRSEPTDQQWADLRWCESTGRYDVATGNGYWGAYQFDVSTWITVGGSAYPSDAPPEEQDARARLLFHRRGWRPWPVCGRFLPQE